LGAFSTFFTQSPSFLANQKNLQKAKGQSNAQRLFHLQEIPSDNHIRQMLDPVPPEKLFPCYDAAFESLRQAGHLESWRVLQDTFLIALDGTWYHSSDKIHCPNCSCLEHKSGGKTYYHSTVTPVLVAPGHEHAIPLRPEFITPQDGHTKQDCEIAAAKRWLEKNAAQYAPLQATLLGDDLYAHQPFAGAPSCTASTLSSSASLSLPDGKSQMPPGIVFLPVPGPKYGNWGSANRCRFRLSRGGKMV